MKTKKIFLFLVLTFFLSKMSFAQIIIDEQFNTGTIPTGWTVSKTLGGINWTFEQTPVFLTTSGGYYAKFNDSEASTLNDAVLTSPVINCKGRTSVKLRFEHFWDDVELIHCYVEASPDGVVWTKLYSDLDAGPGDIGSYAVPTVTTIDITSLVANQSNAKVRFRFVNEGSTAGKSWNIDNVLIYTDPGVEMSEFVTPDYLGCSKVYQNNEEVTVKIVNQGIFNISNIPVKVDIVTGAAHGLSQTLSTVYSPVIMPKDTGIVTFSTQLVDMTQDDEYGFYAYTELPGDGYLFDDSLYTSRRQKVTNYDHLEDFDLTSEGWKETGGNAGNYWKWGKLPSTYLNGDESNDKSWYLVRDGSSTYTTHTLESTVFDFSNVVNPTISFDLKYDFGTDWCNRNAYIQYRLADDEDWVTLGDQNDQLWYNCGSNTCKNASWSAGKEENYIRVQKDLCNLVGESCVKFRFVLENVRYSDKFSFDNFLITDRIDVGVTKLLRPAGIGCDFEPTQQLQVVVANWSCTPVSNIDIKAEITGAITQNFVEVVAGPIEAGKSANYTFPATFDMSVTGEYDFNVYTESAIDQNHDNDSLKYLLNINLLKVNTYPYTENFDANDGSWYFAGGSPDIRWQWGALNGAYLGGPEAQGSSWYLITDGASTYTDVILEGPIFDFSENTRPKISFDIKYDLIPDWCNRYVYVQMSTNGGVSWQTVGPYGANGYNYGTNSCRLYSWSGGSVGSWERKTFELCNQSGNSCVKLRFVADNMKVGDKFAIDNVTVDAGTGDDIGILELSPADAGICHSAPNTGFSNAEEVGVLVVNNTCRTLTNIPMTFNLSGANSMTIKDTIPGPIKPLGDWQYHLFDKTVDMSIFGDYTLEFVVGDNNNKGIGLGWSAIHDTNPLNDVYSQNRYNRILNTFPHTSTFDASNEGWATFPLSNEGRYFHNQNQAWEISSGNGGVTWVESPVYDISALVNPLVTFTATYNLSVVYGENVIFEYSLNGGTTWTKLGSYTDPEWYTTLKYDKWMASYSGMMQHDLCEIQGATCVKFRFKAAVAPWGTFKFDDFTIRDNVDATVVRYLAPLDGGCLFGANQEVAVEVYSFACVNIVGAPIVCDITGPTPDNQLTGNADLAPSSWNTFTFPSTFDMTSPGDYGFTTTISVPSDYRADNDVATHAVHVRSSEVTVFPYFEDFNTDNGDWYAEGGDATNYFEYGALPYLGGADGGGSWYAVRDGSSNYSSMTLTSPVFNMLSVTEPILSFDLKYDLATDYWNRYVYVEYSINGGASWAILGTSKDTSWYEAGAGSGRKASWADGTKSSWTHKAIAVCPVSGNSCVQFRIRAINIRYDDKFAIDNVGVSNGMGDDIQVLQMYQPHAGHCTGFDADEGLGALVQNHTCRDITNLPLEFTMTYPDLSSVTYQDTLPIIKAKSRAYHIFDETLDMTMPGDYKLEMIPVENLTGVGFDKYEERNFANDKAYEVRYNSKINTFPYTADFETDNMGWASSPLNNIHCFWRNDTLPHKDGEYYYMNGSEGNNKAWYVDHYGGGAYYDNIYIETPVFDFTSMASPVVSFDVKYSIGNDYNLHIFYFEYSTDGGTTWTKLGSTADPDWYNGKNKSTGFAFNSWSGETKNTWTHMQHTLCEIALEPCVKFRFSDAKIDSNDKFAFDNFVIKDVVDIGATSYVVPVQSGCLQSDQSAITVNIFNWSCTPISNFPVTCEISGALNQTITENVGIAIPVASSSTYTFGTKVDLTAIGDYDFVTYTDRPTEIIRDNDSTKTFITVPHQKIPIPTTEDFNASSGDGAWIPQDGDAGNYWMWGSLPYLDGPQGEGNSWYLVTDGTSTYKDIKLESPIYDLSKLVNPILKFDIKFDLPTNPCREAVHVEYSVTGGETWEVLGLNTDDGWYTSSNCNAWTQGKQKTWLTVSQGLCELKGYSCVMFRIVADDIRNNDKFALDNFKIFDLPVDMEILAVRGCYGHTNGVEVDLKNNNLEICQPYILGVNIADVARSGTLVNMDNTDWIASDLSTNNSIAGGCSAGKTKALDFDGINDYVSIPLDDKLNFTQGTIETWFKTSNAGSGRRGIIVKSGAWGIFLRDNLLETYNYQTNTKIETHIALADNTWHHVALSINNGVTNGSKLYVDGSEVSTFTIKISSNASNVVIGGTAGEYFAGSIDEVRIWDVIRDSHDITNNACSAMTGTETGMVGYYDMEDGSGTVLTDHTGGSTSGTATASSEFNTSYKAKYAFDNNSIDKGWLSNPGMPAWLSYDLGATNATAVEVYRIYCSSAHLNGESYNPKSWTFEGSNDNSTWDVLDNVANGYIAQNSWAEYEITNTTAYRYYRINISATEWADRVRITELQLYDDVTRTPPVVTNIDLSYTVDNGPVVTNHLTGFEIRGGEIGTLVIPDVLIPEVDYEFKVWLSLPNGIPESINFNDTLLGNIYEWPGCNDHCNYATKIKNHVTQASQTNFATDNPAEDPAFSCKNPGPDGIDGTADDLEITVENTVWYYFTTDCDGGDVEVTFRNIGGQGCSNGVQVSIDKYNGPIECDPANYTNEFCYYPNNREDFTWNGIALPAETDYYITIDGVANGQCDFELFLNGSVGFDSSKALEGDYSINAGNPNYPTFQSAMDSLMMYGVKGPVHFTARDTIYYEQLNLGEICGVNKDTLVTFSSTCEDCDKPRIEFEAGPATGECGENFGNALSFDGIDDYVNLGTSRGLEIAGNQTLEMWIKPYSFNARRSPFHKAVGGEGSIIQETNGTLTYYYGTSGTNGAPYQTFNSNASLAVGTWNHIAVIRDLSNMQLKWYINGILTNTAVALYPNATISTYDTYIGKGTVSNYYGEIDELRIWKRARSEADLFSTLCDTLSGSETSLNSYYRMEEGPGDVLKDYTIRNKNHGSLENMDIVESWVFSDISGLPGECGKNLSDAVEFDGTDDYIYADNESNFDFENNQSFTIETWVRTNTTGRYKAIASKMDMSEQGFELGHTATGELNFIISNSSGNAIEVKSERPINDGGWHHVAVTYDGSLSANGVKLYIDGSLDNMTTIENTLSASVLNNTPLNLGKREGTSDYCFEGAMDEFRIWDIVRTETEIDDNRCDIIAANTANLVTYYRMEDGRRGDILSDLTGNTNTGHLTNMSVYTDWVVSDINGLPDGCGANFADALSFDGINDFVLTPTNSVLTNNSFTIEAWAKRTTTGAWNYIFSQGTTSNNNGLQFGFTNTNTFLFGFYSNDLNTVTTYTDNDWHHWAGTYDAVTKERKLYRDGALIATDFASANFAGSGGFNIGRRFDGNLYFKGELDELRIWNKVLTASELNASKCDLISAADPNLVGYYQMEDGPDGVILTDLSSSSLHGSLTNMDVHASWIDSDIDGLDASCGQDFSDALQFDGSNDYVITATNTELQNQSFTIEAWAKRTTTGAWNYIFSQGTTSNNNGLSFGFTITNTFVFGFYGNDLNTVTAYTDNNWHHWAGTYDATTNERKIYRDGVMVASDVATADFGGSGGFNIGRRFDGNMYFKGQLDEIRVWKKALTSTEINTNKCATIIGTEGNLVAYYQMEDGPDGVLLTDLTTNHYDGELTNMSTSASWVDSDIDGLDASCGQNFAYALEFDGSDDFATSSSNTELTNNSFTIEAWAKRNTTGAYNCIFSQGSLANNNGLIFGFTNTNTFVFGFYSNDLNTASSFTDTDWHHWAGTYDATTNERKIYRDGILVASDVATADFGGSGGFNIGRRFDGNYYFNGQLDELRIWNKALSSSELNTSKCVLLNGDEAGLVAYYQMEDGPDGVLLTDLTVNEYHAALTNMSVNASWVDSDIDGLDSGCGQNFAHAIEFDGSNDYVFTPTNSELASSSFTIEVWAKRNTTGAWNYIFSQGSLANNNGLSFGFTNTNTFVFGFYNNDLTTVSSFTDTDWHHWAGTYDATTNERKIYRDGILVASGIATADFGGSGGFNIGRRFDGNMYFNGQLDELRIWNKALSTTELNTNMCDTLEGHNANLVAYYQMEDGPDGTILTDSTSNGYHGNLTNMISAAGWVDSDIDGLDNNCGQNFDEALEFDGSNDYATSPVNSALVNNSFTIEVWAKRNTTGAWNYIFGQGANVANQGLQFGFTNTNTFRFGFTSNDLTTVTAFTDSKWHHWAGTYDAVTKERKIYRDGSLVASDVSISNFIGSGKFYIGSSYSPSNYFNGQLDELRIWNKALTVNEINATKCDVILGTDGNLVAYYQMNDGPDGTLITDLTANQYHANLTNMITMGSWVDSDIDGLDSNCGQNFDGALEFNGSNEYAISQSNTELQNKSFTIEVWAKRNTIGAWNYIFSQGSLANNNGLQFGFTNTNTFIFGFYSNDLITVSSFTDTEWHHWAGTYDAGTNERKIYRDGVLVASDVATADFGGSGGFNIGRRFDGNMYFKGQLDELRVWDKVLDVTEINASRCDLIVGNEANLVAYYQMEEGPEGSLLVDLTANEYHASLYNMSVRGVWVDNDIAGIPASCGQNFSDALDFDGSNDYCITQATNSELTSGSFTVEAWAKRNTISAYNYIFSQGTTSNNNGLYIGFRNDNTFCFSFYNNDLKTSSPYLDNDWHHWACTYDVGTKDRKIYRDGILIAADVSASDFLGSGQFNIGRLFNATCYFKGELDEIRVWNKALTSTELNTNMCDTLDGHETNLVAYYQMEDGSDGTFLTDSTSNGYHAYLYNFDVVPNWINSDIAGIPANCGQNFSEALDFDGSNDCVITGTNTELQNNSFTIEAWAKRNTLGAYNYIFSQGTTSTNNGLSFGFRNDNTFWFSFYNNDLKTSIPYLDNEWHHWAATYDAVTKERKLYRDGVLAAADISTADFAGSGPFNIGRLFNGSCYFKGELDEVRVWNKVLSESEINTSKCDVLTLPQTGLISYYKMEDGQFSTILSDETTGYNGTLTNMDSNTDWVSSDIAGLPSNCGSDFAGALSFDGANDYVELQNESNFDLSSALPFTIEAWINTNSSTTQTVFSKLNNNSPYTGYELQILNTGQVYVWVVSDFTTNNYIAETTTATVNDGVWHHIALTYDGSLLAAGLKIYIDGVLQTPTVNKDNLTGEILNNFKPQIGRRINISTVNFKGKIDEVRIWSVEKTQAELNTAKCSALLGTEGNLIAYYAMDDGPGSYVLSDESGNGNIGALNNAIPQSDWVSSDIQGLPSNCGQNFATALEFDGSNDYVEIQNESNFDFAAANAFTIETWVNTYSTATQTVVSKLNNASPNTGYELQILNTGQVYTLMVSNLSTNNYIAETTSATVNDGRWHHIAMTYDGSSLASGLNIYIDGILQPTTVNYDNLTGEILNNFKPQIGRRVNVATINFKGKMDEVRFWNFEKPAAQINSEKCDVLTGAEAGLVAYYDMEDGTGSGIVSDISLNGNTGSLMNMNTSGNWVTSEISGLPGACGANFGGVLQFDGVDDYVEIAEESNFDYDYTDAFTIEGWVNTIATSSRIIFSKMNNAAPYTGYELNMQADGTLYWWMVNSWSTNALCEMTTSKINDGIWHHIAVTYDGSRDAAGLNIYIDGVLQPTIVNNNSLTGTILNNYKFQIGRRVGLTTGEFIGQIDEVRVWDVERTSAELNAAMCDTLPNPTATAGLNAYYEMEDGTGSTVLSDIADNGNIGSLVNMVSETDWVTSDISGSPDNCGQNFGMTIELDGVNDYVELSNESNFDFSSTGQFTIEAWINTSSATVQTIVSKMNNAAPYTGYELQVLANGTLYFWMPNTWSTNAIAEKTTTIVNDGVWHHVAVTYDGSLDVAGLKIYIDGIEQPTVVDFNNLTGEIKNDYKVQIGRRLGNGTINFKGKIDELRFWNVAKTTAQLNAAKCDLLTGAEANLVAYYQMEDGLGSQILSDISGNENLGSLTNITTYTSWVTSNISGLQGNCGQDFAGALQFDGADDYVELQNESPFDYSSVAPFTIEAWVNTSTSTTQTVISKMLDGNYTGYELQILPSGQLYFWMSSNWAAVPKNALVETSTTTVNDGTWHHVAVTYDGSKSSTGLKIYVDGVLDATVVNNDNLTGEILNDYKVLFGQRRGNTTIDFKGKLDEVRFWSVEKNVTELNTSKCATITGSEANLLGYYQMEDGSGSLILSDISGNENLGSLVNMITYTDWVYSSISGLPGGCGQTFANALQFDGVDDYVEIQNESNFDYSSAAPFTIEAWVNTNLSVNQSVISKMLDGNNTGYELQILPSGQLYFWMSSNWAAVPKNALAETSTTTVNDGTWHHIAVTYDGTKSSSGLKIYVDGILDATVVNNDDLTGEILNDYKVLFGQRRGNTTLDFKGKLDEVRFWSVEKNVTELNADKCAIITGTEANLDAYYQMEDGSGSQILTDVSGNTNTGSLVNMTTYSDWVTSDISGLPGGCGQNFAGALEYDGINDYVEIQNESPFDLSSTGTFTIETWVSTNATKVQSLISKILYSGTDTGYELQMLADGKLYFLMSNDWTAIPKNAIAKTSATSINDGTWHHIAITYDGSKNASGVKIYVDGILDATVDNQNNLTGEIKNNLKVQLGRTQGVGTVYFKGKMDEVRFWSVEKSFTEINNAKCDVLTGTEANLTAYYQMNDGVGSEILSDISGNNNLGSLVNMSINSNWRDSDINGLESGCGANFSDALQFDGNNDVVELANESNLDLSSSSPFTIEIWLSTSSTSTQTVLSKMNNTAPYTGYELQILSGGQIYFWMPSTWNTDAIAETTNTKVNDGEWHHIAVTYDGSKDAAGLNFYIDGVLQPTVVNNNNLTGEIKNNITMLLGQRTGNGTLDFKGKMDELRIWSKEKTSTEISAGMCDPLTGKEADLISYFNMEDGPQGTKLSDVTGNGSDGTLSNMSTYTQWIAGNIGASNSAITEYRRDSENFVMKLDGAKYYNFRNIDFAALDTVYSRVIHLAGNANYILFDNCYFYGDTTLRDSINTRALLYVDETSAIDTLRITNGKFLGGSYGVHIGVTTNRIKDFKIENTEFENQSYTALMATHLTSSVISYNEFTTKAERNNFTGLHLIDAYGATKIENNTFINSTADGFAVRLDSIRSVSGSEGLMVNNVIGFGTADADESYCLLIDSASTFFNVYHNTFNLTSNAGASIKVDKGLASGNVKNNVFSSASANSAVVDATSLSATTFAYNAYNPDFASKGTGSIFQNPGFISSTDLHTEEIALRAGTPVGVTLDFDDEKRSTVTPYMGADEYLGAVSWTGAVSNDWNDPNNWTSVSVPTRGTTVEIANSLPNYPEINSASSKLAEARNITIADAAHLHIEPMKYLTVYKTFTNHGEFKILSDNQGFTGSFIPMETPGTILNPSGTGKSILEQYISKRKWHYIGSPISTAGGLLTSDYYWWDETIQDRWYHNDFVDWNDGITKNGIMGWKHASGVMGIGEGYALFLYTAPMTAIFDGTFNSGDYDVNLDFTDHGGDDTQDIYDGWNLLANPYPSTINWSSGGIELTNVDNAFYVYSDPGDRQYDNYEYYMRGVNGSPYPLIALNASKDSCNIAPAQSVFVRANATGAKIKITNVARRHRITTFYKSGEIHPNLLKLSGEHNGATDELAIRFIPESNTKFDGEYDALKRYSSSRNVPQISSQAGAIELAINTLPEIYDNLVIPLSFMAGEKGEYSIKTKELNFEENVDVFLIDKALQKRIKLNDIPDYNFTVEANNYTDRFYIIFKIRDPLQDNTIDETGDVQDMLPENVLIYSSKDIVYIKFENVQETDNEVIIQDILGKKIIHNQLNSNLNTIPMDNFAAGNYIVKVITKNKVYEQKVFIE